MRYSELELFGKKVSLKIIGFSMEMPCWSPSEGLQTILNILCVLIYDGNIF